MKKIIAAALSLILLLSCCAALAETAEKTQLGTISMNGEFKLQCSLPEDYRLMITKKNDLFLSAVLSSPDPAKPMMQLIIGYDDMYANVKRMNDLSEEDLMIIAASFEEDIVEISYTETAYGTLLMVAREVGDDTTDFISFISVYEGYMIEFLVVPGEEAAELTDEQIQTCIDFLSELDFIPLG